MQRCVQEDSKMNILIAYSSSIKPWLEKLAGETLSILEFRKVAPCAESMPFPLLLDCTLGSAFPLTTLI